VQESLYSTIKQFNSDDKIKVEELENILGAGIDEVAGLCKKACLKPKTDSMGNTYFTKNDIDTLKKVKELYSRSKEQQDEIADTQSGLNISNNKTVRNNSILNSPNEKINFLQRAKSRVKHDSFMASGILGNRNTNIQTGIQGQLEKLENNLINKISELLSEKMDGFDEIIVELIRSKTENENLRQQVNNMNKQLFILKKELSSYVPLPFGLYSKRDVDEFEL